VSDVFEPEGDGQQDRAFISKVSIKRICSEFYPKVTCPYGRTVCCE
jgi:hypothetical protein